ncbi:MAG: DUF47 domain-containing protein [Nitrososphaeria archaeon]
MGSIFSIFRSGEKELLDSIRAYYDKLHETLMLFQEFLIVLGEHREHQDLYEKIDRTETEADEVHEKLAERIASGSFFSYIRDDFLDLIEKMDYIADYSKDVAKMLNEYNVSPKAIDFLFTRTLFRDYIKALIRTVEALGTVLSMLRTSPPKDILSKIKDVESAEEKADFIKDKILIELHNCSKELDILDVITLREAINLMDNIADSAEDSSDIIIRLIAKGYK